MISVTYFDTFATYGPRYEKPGFLQLRKQADQRLCPLLPIMVIILFTVYTQLLAFSQCSDLSYINISKYVICCRASINSF